MTNEPKAVCPGARVLFVTGLFGLCLTAVSAAPMGTAFNYQGYLTLNGNGTSGQFDMRFELYSAATGPGQVGPTVTRAPVDVSKGLFSTSIDFGSGIFDGTAYWLEVAIRPNGSLNAYDVQSPRVEIRPVPYALFAGEIASGQVVKSLNGLFDDVTLAAGANVTITPSANTLTIASVGGGVSGWSLTGNAGTTAGLNFLGTSDGQPLEFKVNNSRALRLESVFTIFGGSLNTIGGHAVNRVSNGAAGATIAGGGQGTFIGDRPNEVAADFGTVGGGEGNSVGGTFGTVPGGSGNRADGIGSFAAGQVARATHDGSFVWGDGTQVVASTGPNRFEILATGGATFHTGGANTRAESPYLAVQGAGGEEAYIGGDGLGNDVQIGSLSPSVSEVFMWNAATSCHMNLHVATLIINGGCDLAEPFEVSAPNIPKGAVVIIDEDHPGRLKLSDSPYDTRVAGVVSGANGIRPGIMMHQQDALEGSENVALSGRVYVLADAREARIKPGDLLTTSATPGHAMKVTDHARAQGAILGKAMSALPGGKGMVLVLVTLQ